MKLRARADLSIEAINRTGLSLKRDEPPPRHATIEEWPPEPHERMSLAQMLADDARLVVRGVSSDGFE